MENKTAGYNRRIFGPPTLLKMPLHKLLFSKFSHFFANTSIWVGKTFQEMLSFDRIYQICHLYRFWKKKNLIFDKTQISWVFEKSYYFIRILRQICYNLVIEDFQIQNGVSLSYLTGIVQLASKRKKTHAARETVSFHIINIAENNEARELRFEFLSDGKMSVYIYQLVDVKLTHGFFLD